MPTHRYEVTIDWTGNRGAGTEDYRAYARSHDISGSGKPVIPGSADPEFRGDRARWNPEELLLASLAACHQLWYLHLAADAGVTVVAYRDRASGMMIEEADGAGRFVEAVLYPRVTIAAGSDPVTAQALHERAHAACFIANSVNFPVRCEPAITLAPP